MKKTEQQPKLSDALRANLRRRKGQKMAKTVTSKPTPRTATEPTSDEREHA